jgi:hypothetical protein
LIHSRTNQIEDLLPFVDAILNELKTIKPGQIVSIPHNQITQPNPLDRKTPSPKNSGHAPTKYLTPLESTKLTTFSQNR